MMSIKDHLVGNRIRQIRELKKYSGIYVASKLDIPESTYYKIEKGEATISTDKLAEIAQILDVNIEDLTNTDSAIYFNIGTMSGGNVAVSDITAYNHHTFYNLLKEEMQNLLSQQAISQKTETEQLKFEIQRLTEELNKLKGM